MHAPVRVEFPFTTSISPCIAFHFSPNIVPDTIVSKYLLIQHLPSSNCFLSPERASVSPLWSATSSSFWLPYDELRAGALVEWTCQSEWVSEWASVSIWLVWFVLLYFWLNFIPMPAVFCLVFCQLTLPLLSPVFTCMLTSTRQDAHDKVWMRSVFFWGVVQVSIHFAWLSVIAIPIGTSMLDVIFVLFTCAIGSCIVLLLFMRAVGEWATKELLLKRMQTRIRLGHGRTVSG